MPTIMNSKDYDQAVKLTKEVFEFFGYPDLHVEIDFSNRMKVTAGKAIYSVNGNHIIRLSRPIWDRITEEEKAHTIKHEACHIISHKIFGMGIKGHGLEWKNCMLRIGEKPNRCHNYDVSGLRNKKGKVYNITCACNKIREIGHIRAKRIMLNEASYICKKCKSEVKLVK